MSLFNRIYRANIVTSGPRSTSIISRANFVTCGTHTTQSQRIACFNRISCTNIVTSLLAIACKARLSLHCDGTQAIVDIMVEFIRNPVSSYFHSQVFIFMRLSSLALPWIAIFARKCDCHAMVSSLAIARIAISTRSLRLSSLRIWIINISLTTGLTS